MQGKVEICGVNTAKLPVLKANETRRLLEKARSGDEEASQNVQFSTYGVPMIAGELRRFLRDHSAIRVSRSMRDTAYRVLQAKEKLTAENGREPDVEQIAAALSIPRQEVVFALRARR